MRILQIANYTSDVGGISVQVKQIHKHLVADGYACDILSTKGSLLRRLLSIIKLLRLGKGYDVFHIHACSDRGFFPAIVGVSIGRLIKKRIVLTYHGGGAEAFFIRYPKLVRYFLNRTDSNIVLSGFVGALFDRFQIPYTIIPNIVELKDGVFRDRIEMAPRFVSIRSLHEIYNIECTLRAFKSVQEQYPEASLMIIGDGPLRGELQGFVEKHQIKHVCFWGQVRNEEIYQYLDQCDIMISSSRFDNMPVSVLEGFNAGLLVIASNVGGVPYMIQDGENGFLFESDNDQELAQKMIYALENSLEVQRMIENAHGTLYHYSWDFCREKLMRLYTGG